MKTFPRLLSLSLVTLTLAGLLLACGQKDRQYEKVDISAQVQQLSSPDASARADACAALGSAGPNAAPAVPDLIATLKDSDALVRRLAAYALGEIGPAASQAVPALQATLNDSDPSVIPAAVNALRAIDPDTFGTATVAEMRKMAPR
jgi:HEAT repeat protein